MFKLRSNLKATQARAAQGARAASASAPRPVTVSQPRAKPLRGVRQRIKYREQAGKMIAEVQERRGLRWLPTGVQEVVDLNRAADAVRISQQRLARLNGVTGGLSGGSHSAMSPFDMEAADTAGFWKKVKKAAKKIGKNKVIKVITKAHTVPLKAVHKITHGKNSPIRKAELALQKTITKNLPITKPFIAVHNKIAGATHKVIEGKKAKRSDLPSDAELKALKEANKRTKAEGIAKALKKVPPAQQKAVKDHLVKKATSWIVTSPDTNITYDFKL